MNVLMNVFQLPVKIGRTGYINREVYWQAVHDLEKAIEIEITDKRVSIHVENKENWRGIRCTTGVLVLFSKDQYGSRQEFLVPAPKGQVNLTELRAAVNQALSMARRTPESDFDIDRLFSAINE